MVTANIHQAKTNLSKLIERAEAGEEVVIARNGKPVVRLTVIEPAKPADIPRRPDGLPAWMGSMKGEISYGPGFDKSDEEIRRSFEESKIFPWEDDGP
jgi:prevent-host-death family protein